VTVSVDVLVIGAGPTGLYAAYYAGFRGLSVALMDSLPALAVNNAALVLDPAADLFPGHSTDVAPAGAA
jgi:flavin-dependent dehydrogenase